MAHVCVRVRARSARGRRFAAPPLEGACGAARITCGLHHKMNLERGGYTEKFGGGCKPWPLSGRLEAEGVGRDEEEDDNGLRTHRRQAPLLSRSRQHPHENQLLGVPLDLLQGKPPVLDASLPHPLRYKRELLRIRPTQRGHQALRQGPKISTILSSALDMLHCCSAFPQLPHSRRFPIRKHRPQESPIAAVKAALNEPNTDGRG